MTKVDSVSKEIVKRLALHMKAKMPELAEVLEDWPETNHEMQYPTLSIMTGAPVHRPFAPVEKSRVDSPDDSRKLLIKTDIGDYEWRMQLDMWCGNKPERHSLYEKFYRAFNSQLINDEREMAGLTLVLENYHGIDARYEILSYDFDTDSEEATQRKEWRSKIVILAHCRAIVERELFKTKEIEVHSDIRTDIKVDVASDFSPDIIPVTQ